MNTKSVPLKHLEDAIHCLRTHMITVGISKGFNHPDTIKYSQTLDVLLNRYQKTKLN
ncbi:aspartyl-phosphate phosphatase Spo0E family protein [Peribacillus asahii]|uniref:Uncharacterized protein n=1 Tax=Peribacillus asahii TaxID=228899 RepID=A0A3Q9RN07_9BACI|nr:aspartyl-phosphate phosphatase Spo0E family protein [Peribacillus asahii]AZV43249.1 hypothetical protein BAOM_2640 [Peribacillus asahii]USK83323.1 aspartyl-phosphate phosphatase Spo0E family protein [Peribacillus asahii]